MTEPYERFPGLCLVRTSDLDEALGRMGEVYLPHRIDLLDAESALDVQLNALRLGSVTAGYVSYGAEIRVVTAEARDYHVNIPLVGRARSRSGRRDPVFTAPGRAAIFMPGAPAEIEWGAGSAQLSPMLDRRAVDRELERLLGAPAVAAARVRRRDGPHHPGGASFLAALDLVEREAGRPDGMLRFPAAAAHLEGLVIHGLLLAQPHNHSDELRHGDASLQPRAVRQAIELIEERPEHAWTITELAATVAVSVRTLQDRFAQSVGIPPMTYLRDLRLDRVHAQLLAADPHEVTVGSVAASWGFLHAGRFAVAYKRRFGRSPSATLRSG